MIWLLYPWFYIVATLMSLTKLQKDSGHSQPLPYSPSWVVFRPNVLVDARTGSILVLYQLGQNYFSHVEAYHYPRPHNPHLLVVPCLHKRKAPSQTQVTCGALCWGWKLLKVTHSTLQNCSYTGIESLCMESFLSKMYKKEDLHCPGIRFVCNKPNETTKLTVIWKHVTGNPARPLFSVSSDPGSHPPSPLKPWLRLVDFSS